MTRTHLLIGTALAALGLAPLAAHAQGLTLNNGDVVTVDGTGTHGTINNGNSTYTDSSFFYAVETNGTAAFTLGAGGTLTAGINDIALLAQGSGPITVTGGTVTAGTNGAALFVNTSGPVTITGGTFAVGSNGTGLVAAGTGPITITGGTFTAAATGVDLGAEHSAAIDLYGAFDGLAPGQTQSLASGGASGSFVGTLENDTAPQTFTYLNSATITLHDVAAAPEPSEFVALAIGALGLGVLTLRARRRSQAA